MKIRVPIKKDPNDTPRRVPIRRGALVFAVITSFLGLFMVWVYSTWNIYKNENLAVVATQKITTDSDVASNLNLIAKKMWLPKDAKPPRVLEITDPELLASEQSFYKGAESGDILVIFDQSKRAILYSPRRDIILNVGPITYSDAPKDKTL